MTPEPSTAWNEGPGVNGLHPHIPDRLNSERPFPTSGRFAVAAAAPAPTPAVPAADPRSVTQPLVAVTAPVNSPGPYETPSPPLVDGDESSLESSAFPAAGVPRKRRSFAWVAALVVVGAAGLLAWTYGRSYLVRKGLTIAAAPTSVPDTRVVEYLAKADGAFADGDVERAEEGYYKASALAEHDPRVLLGLARAAGYKADVAWLQVRLASELGSGEDETRAVLLGLEDAAAKALRAAENALAVTPAEAPAVRTKIDALRAIGSIDQARKFVSELKSTAPSETAYTLAMLDLAEKEPSGWTAILERLRTAALVEGGSGRARAALVYALAKSGDRATAAQELERLARQPRVHPALPRLRAYVERPKKSADAGVAGVPAADAGPQSTAAGSSAASQGAPMGGGGTSDPRKLLLAADVARRRGDLGTATQLYEAVLARSPRDSEALGGLGDVAHERRDYPSAKSYYTRALGINSRFLPAKIGMADILWESGDKSAGADAYQDIVDHHPEGAYPAYVKSRAESASK